MKGSHNDVDDVKALLMGKMQRNLCARRDYSFLAEVYGWQESEIILLKDDDENSPLYPTREVVVSPFVQCSVLVLNLADGPSFHSGTQGQERR